MNLVDTIYIHITKICNLRCVYCYFSAGEPMERELSTDEMLDVLKNVHLLNPRRIVLTGGEPLLRIDVLELANGFNNINHKIKLCLTTNGILINKKNANKIVKQFDEIRISIDGFKEINDRLRGSNTFEKVFEAFRYILNEGGNPVAFITITHTNLGHLKDFMGFLLSNGIHKIHISPLKIVGRANDDKLSFEFKEIINIVDEFIFDNFGVRLKSESKKAFNCGVGKYISIHPDGSVYPCHVLAFPEYCIGNVRKDSLYNIYYNSSLMNKLRNLNFNDISKCAECFKELSNEGTCLGIHAQSTSFRKQFTHILS